MATQKKLLKVGVPLLEELEGLTSKPPKLSASGCLQGSDRARLQELDKRMNDDPESFRYTHQFLRNAQRWIKEKTFTGPPKDIRRLRWLSGPNWDGLLAELAALQSSVFELFFLAIAKVAESNPEVFGPIDNLNDYHQRAAELNKELEEICQKIEENYDRRDLMFGETNPEGYARVSFKISNSEVAVTTGCGKKLIAWCSQNRHVLEG